MRQHGHCCAAAGPRPDLAATDSDGDSALTSAAARGHTQVAALLVWGELFMTGKGFLGTSCKRENTAHGARHGTLLSMRHTH